MSDEHRQDYSAPWQVALREAPGAGLCSDVDCDLSGGYAHIGECAPCACGKRHAIEECPEWRGCALTPSDVALAKVLAAWEAWPGDRRDASAEAESLRDIGELMKARGYARWTGIECVLTDAGRALLDRARKTGVL